MHTVTHVVNCCPTAPHQELYTWHINSVLAQLYSSLRHTSLKFPLCMLTCQVSEPLAISPQLCLQLSCAIQCETIHRHHPDTETAASVAMIWYYTISWPQMQQSIIRKWEAAAREILTCEREAYSTRDQYAVAVKIAGNYHYKVAWKLLNLFVSKSYSVRI